MGRRKSRVGLGKHGVGKVEKLAARIRAALEPHNFSNPVGQIGVGRCKSRVGLAEHRVGLLEKLAARICVILELRNLPHHCGYPVRPVGVGRRKSGVGLAEHGVGLLEKLSARICATLELGNLPHHFGNPLGLLGKCRLYLIDARTTERNGVAQPLGDFDHTLPLHLTQKLGEIGRPHKSAPVIAKFV